MKDLGLYEGLAPEFTLKRVAVQSCHNILPFDNDWTLCYNQSVICDVVWFVIYFWLHEYIIGFVLSV